MSRDTTPIHSNSSFDPYYDPEFTAEITAKMHVPDKICLVGGMQNIGPVSSQRDEARTMMNVPERIIVAGENKHIAVREPVPELRFESVFPSQPPNCVLQAPPSVLTVDDYPYPTVDFEKCSKKDLKKTSNLDQSATGNDVMNESSMSYAPEDEISLLRKQIRHLSRRVLAVEQENQQRQQREIILYSIGITYFVLKGLIWLHRHF